VLLSLAQLPAPASCYTTRPPTATSAPTPAPTDLYTLQILMTMVGVTAQDVTDGEFQIALTNTISSLCAIVATRIALTVDNSLSTTVDTYIRAIIQSGNKDEADRVSSIISEASLSGAFNGQLFVQLATKSYTGSIPSSTIAALEIVTNGVPPDEESDGTLLVLAIVIPIVFLVIVIIAVLVVYFVCCHQGQSADQEENGNPEAKEKPVKTQRSSKESQPQQKSSKERRNSSKEHHPPPQQQASKERRKLSEGHKTDDWFQRSEHKTDAAQPSTFLGVVEPNCLTNNSAAVADPPLRAPVRTKHGKQGTQHGRSGPPSRSDNDRSSRDAPRASNTGRQHRHICQAAPPRDVPNDTRIAPDEWFQGQRPTSPPPRRTQSPSPPHERRGSPRRRTEPPINDAPKLGEGAGWFTKTVTAVTARDEEDRISREAYPDDNHESPEHVPRRSTRRSQERPRDVNAFATTDPNGNTSRRHMDGRRPTENRRPPPSATDQRRLAEDKSPRRKSSRAVPSA